MIVKRLHISHLSIAAAFALMVMLSACFTGIESTPKITAADVKHQPGAEVTENDAFLSDVLPEPLSKWTPGKRFYITDDKIALIFGASGATLTGLEGTLLEYLGAEEIETATGKRVAQLRFLTSSGQPVTYRTEYSLREIIEASGVDLPFTVDMDLINKVKARMEGQRYYTMTSTWYDLDDRARTGRKFVAVTVKEVLPGNTFYPIKLLLDDENGVPFHLFLSVGADLKAPRKFGSQLSLADPHLRYPDISDATWRNIINGRVAEDMTRDECRLALGAPKSIDRQPGYGYLREIWYYENGIYLIFEDGLLRSFRK